MHTTPRRTTRNQVQATRKTVSESESSASDHVVSKPTSSSRNRIYINDSSDTSPEQAASEQRRSRLQQLSNKKLAGKHHVHSETDEDLEYLSDCSELEQNLRSRGKRSAATPIGKRKKSKSLASDFDSDESDTSSASSRENDASFYRAQDNTTSSFLQSSSLGISESISAYSKTCRRREGNSDFVELQAEVANQLRKYPVLSQFRDHIQRGYSSEAGHEQLKYDSIIKKIRIYVEKDFIARMFKECAELEVLDLYSLADDYDSSRCQTFLKELGEKASGKNVTPGAIHGFCDTVSNTLSRSLASGNAIQGTVLEVNPYASKQLVDHALWHDLKVYPAPRSVVEGSMELLEKYSALRDEGVNKQSKVVYSGSKRQSVTEKDRRYAIAQMLKSDDDLSLIGCGVCQCYPRLLTQTVELIGLEEESDTESQNDSSMYSSDEDGIVERPVRKTIQTDKSDTTSDSQQAAHLQNKKLFCSTECATHVLSITRASHVWRTLTSRGISLLTIPDAVHQYYRRKNSLCPFEFIKILITVWMARLQQDVKLENACRHFQRSSSSRRH